MIEDSMVPRNEWDKAFSLKLLWNLVVADKKRSIEVIDVKHEHGLENSTINKK